MHLGKTRALLLRSAGKLCAFAPIVCSMFSKELPHFRPEYIHGLFLLKELKNT